MPGSRLAASRFRFAFPGTAQQPRKTLLQVGVSASAPLPTRCSASARFHGTAFRRLFRHTGRSNATGARARWMATGVVDRNTFRHGRASELPSPDVHRRRRRHPRPRCVEVRVIMLYDARATHAFSGEDSRMRNGLAELELRIVPTHRDVATLAQDLARIHFEDENIRKALFLFKRAWRVWRDVEGAAGPNLLMCQQEQALCLRKAGQHTRGEAMYDSAMSGVAEVTERYARATAREDKATKAAQSHASTLEFSAANDSNLNSQPRGIFQARALKVDVVDF